MGKGGEAHIPNDTLHVPNLPYELDYVDIHLKQADTEMVGMQRPPQKNLKLRLPPPLPAAESGLEHPKCSSNSVSPPLGPNHDPTPSGDSSPTRPISDWMRFMDFNLCTSGESMMVWSGMGRSLGSIHGALFI